MTREGNGYWKRYIVSGVYVHGGGGGENWSRNFGPGEIKRNMN